MKASKAVSLVFLIVLSLCLVDTQPVKVVENSWTTKEPMPEGLCPEVAVVNRKIYAITHNVSYEYNPATDMWVTKKPMPTLRSSFGVAVYQNKIYAIGGRTSIWEETGVNEVYDPLTDTWETKTPMPTNRSGLRANVVNGKIYLIGGMQYQYLRYFSRVSGRYEYVRSPVFLRINEVYDPITDSWTTKASIPTAVYAHASAVVNNKIYVIGGEAPKSPSRTQIYDPETNTWSYGEPIPTPVVDTAAGATTGVWAPKRIYVIGGRINYGMSGTNINQVYNPESDSWTVGTSMPTARYHLAVAVVNDILYAIGGIPMFIGHPYAVNEQYTPFGYRFVLFLTTWIVTAIVITAVVQAARLVYFRKIKKTTGKAE